MYYAAKDINMEVVVLCLDGSPKNIDRTVKSFVNFNNKYEFFVVIPQNSSLSEFYYPTYKSNNCITCMINESFNKAKAEWLYFVFSGTSIKKNIDTKLSRYINNFSDVIFPVVDRVWNFVDGSVNGLLLNKNFVSTVGNFLTGNDLKLTKLEWADRAITKGAKFKAIVQALDV